jgi:D-ornithine 4,5-aminomutase subunit alpha
VKRTDEYEQRREHLKDLTDQQLYDRFWELAEKVVQPMLDLGYKYTTPSIERSVLLRMGFSSREVKPIVEGAMKKSLMGKGCGHIVWRLAEQKRISIREAGLALAAGKEWDTVESIFQSKEARQ